MISVRQAYLLAVAVSAVLTAVAAWLIIASPGTIDEPDEFEAGPSPGAAVEFTVEQGEGPSEIAENLEQSSVIESGTRFRVLVSQMGFDRLLQAGTYDFQENMALLEVVERLRNGIVTTRSVTVVEGWQLGEIADAVAEEGVARDEFLEAAESTDYDFEFVGQIPDGESLQGYLYPATYSLRSSDTAESVVQRMLEGFEANAADDLAQASIQGLTMHEAVTLASIIEREARLAEEKPIMAQVFLSRLRSGLRLEADPTVQFALYNAGESEEYWKTGLTLDDLEVDSPYNTYVQFGLPPGPIASASAETIAAVINPADTNYLYFVARPDGSHAFAETLEEHLENVEMYQNGGGQ